MFCLFSMYSLKMLQLVDKQGGNEKKGQTPGSKEEEGGQSERRRPFG